MSDDATLDEFTEHDEYKNEWKTILLGDHSYFTRYSGDTPTKSNSDYWGGDILWLSNSEVQDKRVNLVSDTAESITEDGLEDCTAQIIPEGSVILSCTASIEKVAINKKRMATNQQFNSFEVKQGFNSYYLANKFLSMKEELETLGGSTTHNHLSVYLLDKVEVDKPPLSEQRKIATVLHTVDQAIQKTEQIIEQTKRYKSGLKQDIFRGGIGDNTTKELPAIGEIPECWDITTLEDVSEWITDGTHTPYDAKQEGFPCLTGKNIRDYGFNLDDIKLVSEKAFEEMRSRVSPEQGDVLFVKDGSIGYTQVNDLQFEFGLLESVLLIRTNKNKIRPHYLQQLLTWKPFRELLISRRVGTGIERMTISGMKKAEVILPSLEEQNEIEDILLQVDKYIDNESKYLSRLKRFKKGLMQDLLSGEVRTTDVDIDIPEEVAKYG